MYKRQGQTHCVYWQVTRGAAERNHVYGEDMEGKLWILTVSYTHLGEQE